MPTKESSLNTITETGNAAVRRVQYGSLALLLALLALFFLAEHRGNGVVWTWMAIYSLIPAAAFWGVTLSTRLSRQVKGRLVFSAAILVWFVIVRALHRMEGGGEQNIGVFFCAYGLCLPFACVTGDYRSQRGLKWVIGLFLGLGVLLTAYCLLLLTNLVPGFLGDSVYWDGTRFSAMSHPNVCATFLMLSMGACLMCWEKLEKVWQRVLLILWIAAQFGAMALTNARTTTVLVCILLGGSLFCGLRKTGRKGLCGACLAAVVLMGGLFLGSQKLSNGHQESMKAAQTVGTVTSGQLDWSGDMRNLNGRTGIWASACKGLRDNRRILAEGTDYTGLIISQYNPFPVDHAHNSWFEVLYEQGTPALLWALVLTAVTVRNALVLLWRNGDLRKSVAALLVLCILGCSMLEPYLFGTYVANQPIQFLFLLLAGYLDGWCTAPMGEDD